MATMKPEQERAYAEIMRMFRHYYQHEWAPENIFKGKSRLWMQSFNHLVRLGYIERKKGARGFKYKWNKPWPRHF